MRWDFFAGEPITLHRLLESREARVGMQRELIARFRRPIISFTCVMPGAVKRCRASQVVFSCGMRAIIDILCRERISLLHERRRDIISGQEGYIVTSLTDALLLKRLMVGLEEGHTLGRLFDLDVIAAHGKPVSRADIGLPGRRCLVCDSPARGCASRGLHSEREVKEAVCEILLCYEEGL